MLHPVSVGLKFGFLIVLYLFLLWVAASTLFDLRRGTGGRRGGAAAASEATSIHQTADPLAVLEGDFEPRLVVEHADGHQPGVAYDLMEPVTLGRGNVELKLEDPFASTRHATITRQGRTVVIEDLGSTNGTYLNEEELTGPQPLHDGDRIRIGASEFTYFQ
ncbi:MAG: FHA domain-containing protein [Actinomycetota bacterium]|nr:FHA domain-containing protein [Actinomycetota bacterium]